jgi:hypothetical protein
MRPTHPKNGDPPRVAIASISPLKSHLIPLPILSRKTIFGKKAYSRTQSEFMRRTADLSAVPSLANRTPLHGVRSLATSWRRVGSLALPRAPIVCGAVHTLRCGVRTWKLPAFYWVLLLQDENPEFGWIPNGSQIRLLKQAFSLSLSFFFGFGDSTPINRNSKLYAGSCRTYDP